MAANGVPDPSQASDLAEFITVLGELRHWAGGPSYRMLAKRVGPLLRPPQVVAFTTVSSVFQPHRRRLDIDLVTAIVRAFGVAEQEVMRWRQACVRVHVAAKAGGGALRQLPADLAIFTGREAELKELLDIAAGPGGGAATVVVSAIDGMAGVGKTALAVRAGHLLAEKFPDGQLFVDLHAHSVQAGPRDPNEALGRLLQALGLDPRAIPAELEERAKAFRNRLAGSRTLIVLDDAASEQQVRPLLPAGPGCLVLITSRNRLKALDDAHPLPLDVLDPVDATALLRAQAGPDRIAADDPAVARVAELCGYLPLALRITAANLAHRRTWTTEHLEARLRAGLADLAAFDDGDRQVRAAFDLSYDNLTPDQQAAFRHLGLIPGPDGDVYAAAALLDSGLNEADALLQALTDHSLLTETAPGRYRLHDLLREYARTLAAANDPVERRTTALDRLLHYYAHTAQTASGPIARSPRPAPDSPASAHAPDLTVPATAQAWLRTEHANLAAAYAHAHAHHLDHHSIALASAMAEILLSDGPWTRALEVHRAAAETAAQTQALGTLAQIGNRLGEGNALSDLGRVRLLTGDYPGAVDAQTQALVIFRQVGNPLGEANALNDLGRVRVLTGDYSGAVAAQTQALEIFRQIGNPLGEANALNDLGRVRLSTEDYPASVDAQTQALERYRQIGNRIGEGNVLNDLGRVSLSTADYPAAAGPLTRALEIFRQIGHRLGEANALKDLGQVRYAIGDYPGAADAQTQALEIFRQIGNRLGQANALNSLGQVRYSTGDYPAAADAQTQALERYRQIGNRLGQANALNDLGRVRYSTGDYTGAADVQAQALECYRQIGNRFGQADVLANVGRVRHLTGDYPGAVEAHTRALEIFRQIDDRGNEAWALNFYAATIAALGDHPHAFTLYQQALAMNRELHKPDNEAISLEGIGEYHLATGDPAEGMAFLNQALEIYRRLGAGPDIERVQTRLAGLERQHDRGST